MTNRGFSGGNYCQTDVEMHYRTLFFWQRLFFREKPISMRLKDFVLSFCLFFKFSVLITRVIH
jgi:hypothetical protein